MRRNPSLPPRPPAGRQMPSWFAGPGAPRNGMMTPPPPPVEPPPVTSESEYEEIDHLPRHNGLRKGRKNACGLCGTSSAVVACEMCEDQLFCGSCNDMYHRHPKRIHHIRKLIDTAESGKPPLPPKNFARQPSVPPMEQTVASSSLPPVPPPRRNKRFPFAFGMRSANSSPSLVKKTFDPVGTIKRFVGNMAQRPLPLPPKLAPPLPPKPPELGRPMTPSRNHDAFMLDRRQSSPAPMMRHGMNYPMDQGFPNSSISMANLSMQRPSSRNSNGYPDWETQEFMGRQRAQSISAQRFPTSSQDASHFATLQRGNKRTVMNKNSDPSAPPLPPRSYPSQSQLGFQSSRSEFNINQMGMGPMPYPNNGFPPPWNYPAYPMDFQQAQSMMMMGYPQPGMNMKRTPSVQSMGAPHQQFVGWGPVGLGPPMTRHEMDLMMTARRSAERVWPSPSPPPPPRPPSITQSQPVTPQGSFRRKTRPALRRDEIRQNERINNEFVQNHQIMLNQRPSTPTLGRMNPSPIHFQEPIVDEEDETQDDELPEEPEGPWICEHCTFINPKSMKICTVCCKTPTRGYKSTNNNEKQRKGSASSTNEEIPVIKSKLSITCKDKQQATINLVENVERVKSPEEKRSRKLERENGSDKRDDVDADQHESPNQSQSHQIKINPRGTKIVKAKATMNDSNEDVYGSVPIQALTISPKIGT